MQHKYTRALVAAVAVTTLWSSSFVLMKMGLEELGPLSIAAYRYGLASLLLLAVSGGKASVRDVPWRWYGVLGLTGFALAQGLQVVGLYYMDAITVSFLLNLTPMFVLLLGIVFLDERPTALQCGGAAVVMAGLAVFFRGQYGFVPAGVVVTLVSGISWAAYLVISRYHVRGGSVSMAQFTAYPMAMGAAVLLVAASVIEGVPSLSVRSVALIAWLGVLNTALAFFLWNWALQKIEAYRLSVLQNTMLFQITLFAAVFLGETVTLSKIAGIVIVATGVAVVQARAGKKRA